MSMLNFQSFIQGRSLSSDEDQVTALIKHLIDQPSPRVLIQDFPQTEG